MTVMRSSFAALDLAQWSAEVARRHRDGERFAGLYADATDGSVTLTAMFAGTGRVDLVSTSLEPGTMSYPSVTPGVPAAFWYEREIFDLFGLRADGHPRLDPLVLPLEAGAARPCPGDGRQPASMDPHEEPVAGHLEGAGLFTIPHGPVRSGVVESVEYLIETPGENIPHLRVRPHAKHRGVEKRFEALDPDTGVLLAERAEGIASVAHALAYAGAIESITEVEVPRPASLIRVIHAELERVTNHLDVAMRLCDAAALGVATARFGWHKERVMRLRSGLCGSRFGRGVIRLGGVRGPLALPTDEVRSATAAVEKDIASDEHALMSTASFLDRLRATGPLPADLALRHGALGPIGRASGITEDVRVSRPYAAYRDLDVLAVHENGRGDAQARLQVRWAEVHESFRLIRGALTELDNVTASASNSALAADVEPVDGVGIGWAEAPQGEVLYVAHVSDGRLRRVKPRSASFHNLLLFHAVFAGDIFTDFPFIEASFGLSIAGVAS
ncbi:MAG TPA: NADH-quinone oxidoreductase subunit C [Mycobacteriales bacterium]|nr:NADH-quinone oxidoreductase subunit C [Mycobacteriales bacterium]